MHLIEKNSPRGHTIPILSAQQDHSALSKLISCLYILNYLLCTLERYKHTAFLHLFYLNITDITYQPLLDSVRWDFKVRKSVYLFKSNTTRHIRHTIGALWLLGGIPPRSRRPKKTPPWGGIPPQEIRGIYHKVEYRLAVNTCLLWTSPDPKGTTRRLPGRQYQEKRGE